MKHFVSSRSRRARAITSHWKLVGTAIAATAAMVVIGLTLRNGGSDATSKPSSIAQSSSPFLPTQTRGSGLHFAELNRRLPFEPRLPDAIESMLDVITEDGTGTWRNVTVAPGDNLSLIFSRLRLPKTELHAIMLLGKQTSALKQLRPGQIIRFKMDGERIAELVLEIDQLNSLAVVRDGDRYVARTEEIEPEVKIAAASTPIKHSLFLDGQKAGLSDAVIMRLTDIFGWDIDFVLDLRENDHFSVIYEEIYKDGELVKQDRILAAEFVNQGEPRRAVLYTDDQGRSAYYSDKGEAMRKAFLRTPVNFTRISSGFSLGRRHPILNTIRAHRGVDYAAPMGTPVRATADGKIRNIGNGAGYGRVVEMQHGDAYGTLYAHLSRFARGLHRGSSVRQGQVIGYVGKSGLATGPHLHYEFRVKGVHRDPLKVALPKALPIERKYLADFREKSAPLLSQLDVMTARQESTQVAYVAQLDIARVVNGSHAN
jgi:murein DD-endopeptidase MepM/ murein hydrolase activator NlpD